MTESMSKSLLYKLGLVLALTVPFTTGTGCGTAGGDPQLRVEDLELKRHPSGARILTGRLTNDSGRSVSGAQIQITLFDGKNRRVDGMFAVVRDIPSNGSVDFREPVQSDFDVRGARVRSVLVLNR